MNMASEYMDESPNDEDVDESAEVPGEIVDPADRAKAYQSLKNRVEALQESEDVGLTAAKELHDIFNTLHMLTPRKQKKDPKHQKNINEYVLDVTVCNFGSEILVKCIDNLDNDAAPYEPTDFANNIVCFTDETEDTFGEESILKLMNVARKSIQSVPEYNSLYGSFDPDVEFLPKIQKQRQRDPKIEGKKQHLKQVKLDDSVGDSIEHILLSMIKVLENEFRKNNENSIQYLRFVVDSQSFRNTVSNMFYFSFLIKDGRAGIDVVEDVAYIWPLKKGVVKKFYGDGGENSQFISSINMEKWREQCANGPGFIQLSKSSNSRH